MGKATPADRLRRGRTAVTLVFPVVLASQILLVWLDLSNLTTDNDYDPEDGFAFVAAVDIGTRLIVFFAATTVWLLWIFALLDALRVLPCEPPPQRRLPSLLRATLWHYLPPLGLVGPWSVLRGVEGFLDEIEQRRTSRALLTVFGLVWMAALGLGFSELFVPLLFERGQVVLLGPLMWSARVGVVAEVVAVVAALLAIVVVRKLTARVLGLV